MAENAQQEPHLCEETNLISLTENEDSEQPPVKRNSPSLILDRSDIAFLSPVDFGWHNKIGDRQVVGGAVNLSGARFVTVHDGGNLVRQHVGWMVKQEKRERERSVKDAKIIQIKTGQLTVFVDTHLERWSIRRIRALALFVFGVVLQNVVSVLQVVLLP